jgi:hypothetical protein
VDFQFAAVAGAGVHLADGEAAAEARLDAPAQRDAEPLQLRVIARRRRLGNDPGQQGLFQDAEHINNCVNKVSCRVSPEVTVGRRDDAQGCARVARGQDARSDAAGERTGMYSPRVTEGVTRHEAAT